MSTVASESVFYSTIQPHTSVTTYALPSDMQIGNGGSLSDEAARSRRVQQQIQMRLAEKSTLPRQNGSASHYAMSDYGGSSTMKYSTYTPSYSSKSSYMYSGTKTMGPRVSQRQEFSCRSAAPDLAHFQRMSVGGGGGGGGFYQEEVRMGGGGYQAGMRQPSRGDQEVMTMHSIRNMPAGNPWMVDNSDAGSMVSERDGIFGRQYAQSAVNGFTGQVRQGGFNTMTQQGMRRSQSGTLTRSTGMMGGGGGGGGGTEVFQQQQSFKGPAFRTISRITNRNRSSVGSVSGNQMTASASNMGAGGGDRVDGGGFMISNLSGSQGNLMLQRQGNLARSMSIRSMQSVGRGMDIYGGQMELGASNGNLSGIQNINMEEAIQYLKEDDPELQVLGAAYIQHQCYNEKTAKEEVRNLQGIEPLVKLFNSPNQDVRRYATGAMRNVIYENKENKVVLIDKQGIPELVKALSEPDDDLHKNITGILWNLSSKENLKAELAKQIVPRLTEKIIAPAAERELEDAARYLEGSDRVMESPSQAEIFCNTTGCLRNVSSADEKTRQQMRETKGLVDSLVNYIKASIDKCKAEEKGVENAMCILRNLSYQLYAELPPSVASQLKRDQDENENSSSVGCFSPRSKKAKSKKKFMPTFAELAKEVKGLQLLYHPSIVSVYHNILKSCEINGTTRESATGALQNITAGDTSSASRLANWALEQEKIESTLIDLMRTERDSELRSLTGLLRNLSRHSENKDHLATKVVPSVIEKLPEDGNQKTPQDEVVTNLCGILNNLVMHSEVAARDICFYNGINKLMGIKTKHDTSVNKIKQAKAAGTVLVNMYNYKKQRKDYAKQGWQKKDFVDTL
ncbi:plakophilin-3a [Austrofundulus limnaeus]|uniref:Plakophilin-3a n=1 Tax=Austrofundulus limnaeus TaxID=52670 RepID=A0A2I4BMU2_AUSLI|nr:PREDICTED: plakophilin-3 [Austrofundulus limnaeus]